MKNKTIYTALYTTAPIDYSDGGFMRLLMTAEARDGIKVLNISKLLDVEIHKQNCVVLIVTYTTYHVKEN